MTKRVIALGFFDGVHLGHGGLLRMARRRADERGCTASVITFDRHPSAVITGQPTPLLTSQRDREYWMKSLYGMDEVLFIHFDRAMMELSWEEFVDDCLLQDLAVCHMVCGQDYRFGYRGKGTAALLREACRVRGVGFDEIAEIAVDGVPVHSTMIRALLSDGKMEEAAVFLGHPHCLSGRVISGKRLGRTMGVPTANIPVPSGVQPPPCGVYATMVETDGGRYPAVTNVGNCPTVSDGAPLVVEPWLLDYSGDLYGREIRIFFYKKLRDEIRFSSLADLRAEIFRNAAQTREYFGIL
ncbi:MAG: riboflavin biosynthesis protein RibF [Oscillospiraceae bacterium]|nr:riboflavin biosynthesis protein RibF [Oscillospiraceae bacterium]